MCALTRVFCSDLLSSGFTFLASNWILKEASRDLFSSSALNACLCFLTIKSKADKLGKRDEVGAFLGVDLDMPGTLSMGGRILFMEYISFPFLFFNY